MPAQKGVHTINNPPGNPRILIVTPEVTYLPEGRGNPANSFSAKAGRLADVSAALISALFEQMPVNYEEARDSNPVDFLASGIFAAHFVNTVSQTFLKEVVENRHDFVREHLRQETCQQIGNRMCCGHPQCP